MEGIWVKRTGSGTTVVFVHGILSDGDACWRHPSGVYWPELLARDDTLSSIGVYVFTYKTGLFSGSYRLGDVVDSLREHMLLDGVLASGKIIFVCHSMGGIVVRKFLVERATDLIEKGTEVGLLLIASPSLGSNYANWLEPLARLFNHSQADALRFAQSNAWLMDLDREFQNLKESRRLAIQGKELMEDTFVVLKAFLRRQVVEPFSGARYFGEPYKVPNSDHFSIAKIEGENAIQHRLLRQFVLDFVKQEGAGGSDQARVGIIRAEKPPADPTGVSVRERRYAFEALKVSLSRLASGKADAKDQLALQRAFFNGSLIVPPNGAATPVVSTVFGGISTDIQHEPGFDHKLRDFLLPRQPGRLPPPPQLLLIGRSNALNEVKRRLGVTGETQKYDRTVVRGWPGVGKTTLVSALAYDAEIAAHFPDGILWTSLTNEPNVLAELATWGRVLGIDGLSRCASVREAVEQLARAIAEARMLMIVDDVWDPVHALPFLQSKGAKCGLLITTRLPVVADALASAPNAVYSLPLLDEADGLTLLRLLAPEVAKKEPDTCLELVRDLECLPLALHVAGRMLETEARMGWGVDDLLDRLRNGAAVIESKAPVDRAHVENQTIPTVAALFRQSTDALTEQVRDSFALLGAFAPKPATFDLEAMKAVWHVDDPKPIVRELVSRGLVEPLERRFQMHALMVAHARSLLES